MHLITWVNQYGYIVLFLALTLELIAFPLPGEVLMSYVGFLVFKGQLGWLQSIIIAAAGTSTGITLSYMVGYKLGAPFFNRYGKHIHMGPEKLEKTSVWFQKYGNRMLLFAYFIPGVRHITGYFSGITRITFRRFSVYAYIGALFWAATFISLGKVLGPRWEQFHSTVKNYLLIGSLIAALIVVVIYLYRNYKTVLAEYILVLLVKGVKIFHSLRRVKALVAGAAVAFFGLTLLMFGLIQDYLGNEFGQFDKIVIFLTHLIFEKNWASWMNLFGLLASAKVIGILILLAFIWILVKGKNRGLELMFFLIVIAGGKILDVGLRILFHRPGPSFINNLVYTFPSGQTLMVLVTYGFTTFLLLRHSKSIWLKTLGPTLVFIISILVGLSQVYFNMQLPSDVVAGYVFGGVWLSLNILLLEVFRLLKNNNLGV